MSTTTNAPRALVFDHISGEIYWSGVEMRPTGLPTPHGPLSRAQAWLQGWPNKRRAWPLVWLGNRLSSLRYWLWRLSR